MKPRNIFAAVLIASAACLVSCNQMMDKAMQAMMESAFNHDYQDSEKWGKVVTHDLPVVAFDEVELNGAIRLEYTQDSTYSVQVYGNEKAIEAYSISTEDDELDVSLKEGSGSVNKNTPAITLRITAPFLTEIQAMGASEVIFMDSVAQDKGLDINISGAGKVNLGKFKAKELDIHCQRARVLASGAANVTLSGECADYAYTSVNSSSVKDDDLKIGDKK